LFGSTLALPSITINTSTSVGLSRSLRCCHLSFALLLAIALFVSAGSFRLFGLNSELYSSSNDQAYAQANIASFV
jgi:hypothetical protein